MRTTNKLFKSQVQDHIKEAINEDLSIKDVVNNFYKEKYSHKSETRYNKYDAFREWMLGLPSSFNVEYTDHNIHNALKTWFENAGAEYKEQSPDKEAELYYNLVTREFRDLAKKNGVDF